MKFITSLLISTLWLAAPQWGNDFSKAQNEANLNHRYILLNFCGSDWCGPCIKLKKDIFESADFEQYASQHLVLVRADFPRLKKNQLDAKLTSHNESLADKYNSQGKFPLTVLLDGNGKVVKEWEGYPASMSTQSLINDIDAVINSKQ